MIVSPAETLFSSIASTTILNSFSLRELNKKDYCNLLLILFTVSVDFATTLGLKALFLFQFPKASALTELLGPF